LRREKLFLLKFFFFHGGKLADPLLRRDNTIVDYTHIESNTFKQSDSYFEHEKRFIWYQQYPCEDLSLFVYLDESLKVKEEKDYLRCIETHPEHYSL